MKVYEYLEFLVNGEIQQLFLSDVGDMTPGASPAPTATQVINQNKLLSFVNLGNIELHKKFNILRKTMDLDFALAGEEFKLPSDFLHAISCTFTDGEEIPINNERINLVNGVDNSVSVMFTDPKVARIKGTDDDGRQDMLLSYAAIPSLAKTINTTLYLPHLYTEALINYVAYKAHATIDGDMKTQNNTYYLRYVESCKQINLLGLSNSDNLDTNTRLEDNGFV